jgi:hypothetical protein
MRSGRWGYCSNDRCAIHGVDRAQRGLIESLPRPHTRSLPRRPATSDDYPDHSLPQVSTSEHTHDHSHARAHYCLGWNRRRLPSSRLDDVTMTRLDRVPSTMPPGSPPC